MVELHVDAFIRAGVLFTVTLCKFRFIDLRLHEARITCILTLLTDCKPFFDTL